MTDPKTKSEIINEDIKFLLKSRNTLLWVTTNDEFRVEQAIVEAAGKAKYETFFWDCANGLETSAYKPVPGTGNTPMNDPIQALRWIQKSGDRGVYVLRDLHKWFDPQTLRLIANLARNFQLGDPEWESRSEADRKKSPPRLKTLIILSPPTDIPPELTGHVTVIDYPLPERKEIGRILDRLVTANSAPGLDDDARDAAIDAAMGLTAQEVKNVYTKTLVTAKKVDSQIVSSEKRRVVARDKLLTWYDPDPRGFDGIGGLELLKDWLKVRRSAFGAKARAFGLPAPKGVMLVGVPGAGKSLTAKCIAAAWGLPLLRLDFGALRDKFVGESERKIRAGFALAEAVAPCVLWADEIEKALGGTSGPQGDGGVAADSLGVFLTWMQEHTAPVFVIATANDVSNLPPELLRRGRFDEMFWVDLPTRRERRSILQTCLRQFNRGYLIQGSDAPDLQPLIAKTEGFTGAEIASIVPEALFAAFADGERAVRVEDLEKAAANVVPLSRTAKEKITKLRQWATERARPASLPEEQDSGAASQDRVVEMSDEDEEDEDAVA